MFNPFNVYRLIIWKSQTEQSTLFLEQLHSLWSCSVIKMLWKQDFDSLKLFWVFLNRPHLDDIIYLWWSKNYLCNNLWLSFLVRLTCCVFLFPFFMWFTSFSKFCWEHWKRAQMYMLKCVIFQSKGFLFKAFDAFGHGRYCIVVWNQFVHE